MKKMLATGMITVLLVSGLSVPFVYINAEGSYEDSGQENRDYKQIEATVETIHDLMVGIHLENAQDFVNNPSIVKDMASHIGCQLVSRGWSGNQFDKYSDYRDWSSVAQATNEGGALFGAWQSVARIKRGFGGQDDLLTQVELEDFTTRGADGMLYTTGDDYTYDSTITNEAFLDYLLAGAYAQIDAGANCIHYDERGGGEYSSPLGRVGYDDYAIGTANFCLPTSVIPRATADSHQGDNIPDKAIDGDASTYWLSNDAVYFHWIEIDLGRKRTVRQIILSLSEDKILGNFTINYLSDDDKWNDFSPPINAAKNDLLRPSFLVEPVCTSKIRLFSTDNQVKLPEIEVYGQGFRQYLIQKYVEEEGWTINDSRWEISKLIDLTDPDQCPDGTINSFNYREYLRAHGWNKQLQPPYYNNWEETPRGSDPSLPLPPANPLWSDWGGDEYYLLDEACLGENDAPEGCGPALAQSFIPSVDGILPGVSLFFGMESTKERSVTVEIRADNNNVPSNTVLAERSTVVPTGTLDFHWSTVIFSGFLSLEAGKRYWIVLSTEPEVYHEYWWGGNFSSSGGAYWTGGHWSPLEKGFLFQVYNCGIERFARNCDDWVWEFIHRHTKAYGDVQGKTVYVTANGISPLSDYHDAGTYWPPVEDKDAWILHLDGRMVQMAYWKSKNKWAKLINDVPTMMFLDYGFEGFPFQDLATQAERETYLRIYPAEMYASGLRFSYPVKIGWGYEAYTDWNVFHTYTTYDVIMEQATFFNAHSSLYCNVSQSPREKEVKILVDGEWIPPFNGDLTGESPVNETKVSISLMDSVDGMNSYLHVINHNWDCVSHKMIPQSDVPVEIPVKDGCLNMKIVSPDFTGEISLDLQYENGTVKTIIPNLAYYDVIEISYGMHVDIEKPNDGYLYVFNKEIMPLPKNTIIIGELTVEANAYSEHGIDKVEFYIDDELKHEDDEFPHEWLWDKRTFGRHEIKVIAYDNKENNAKDKLEVMIFNIG